MNDIYQSPAYRWISNIHYETWETLPIGVLNAAVGPDAGWHLTLGSANFCFGPGAGSMLTDEIGQVIIILPNNRLFKADLRAETCAFMDYTDELAMVDPKFR